MKFYIWTGYHQQHQMAVDYFGEGMGVSEGHLNPYKLYWYPMQLGWTDGNP